MPTQAQKAERFHALHVRGNPLLLFNVWDPGSACAVTAAGAQAIATGSWSVAYAHGFRDGEDLPLDLAIANLRRIVDATTLPVSVDLESGYGTTPAAVGATVGRAIEAGAIGCNLEDSFLADRTMRETADQVERIRAARSTADASGIAFFINARTDVFLRIPTDQQNDDLLDAAVERGRAYADAGANGLFAPGLVDIARIAQLAERSPLPLNILVGDATPPNHILARHGVARVSYGPRPYRQAMKAVEDAARDVFEDTSAR